jgi:hypothetical protein
MAKPLRIREKGGKRVEASGIKFLSPVPKPGKGDKYSPKKLGS